MVTTTILGYAAGGTMLKLSSKYQLAGLSLAVGLAGGMIVLFTLDAQKKAADAKKRLSQVDVESFEIPEGFRSELRAANDKLRRYASFEDPADWDGFLEAGARLRLWMAQQTPRLNTPAEREVLAKMEAAYKTYLQRGRDLQTLMSANPKQGASLAEYGSFFEQSRHLLDLGEDLARAHFQSREQFLRRSDETWHHLRLSVLCLVLLLFAFALALAALVYRDLIAPLRIRLVASEALAERREKLAALGMLAAGVAHEIRNPLTALKTALFIQQKKLSTTSEGHAEGQIIEREVLRLERIVTEFLQFARPAKPQAVTIPATQPLDEVQALLGPELAKAAIQLVRGDSESASIRVDPAQIKQVIINLVQNAADSIGRNGTVTLRARTARQPLAGAETEVVLLEVTDTGKGIAPEVEKRLFDPFFTTKEQGTGLGLSIAARIVEMNAGALQYQTQLKRGSTFGIVLPQATWGAASGSPASLAPVEGGAKS